MALNNGTSGVPGFFAFNTGDAQRLPNGNTLIDESVEGRFFEVTSTGEIVWEYVSLVFHEADLPGTPDEDETDNPDVIVPSDYPFDIPSDTLGGGEFSDVQVSDGLENQTFRVYCYPLDYAGVPTDGTERYLIRLPIVFKN